MPSVEALDAGRLADLTERQREILMLLGKGYPKSEIARRLGLGYFTVIDHCKAILRELEVGSVVEAAVIAAKAGLL